jgi:hypothetical protein
MGLGKIDRAIFARRGEKIVLFRHVAGADSEKFQKWLYHHVRFLTEIMPSILLANPASLWFSSQ